MSKSKNVFKDIFKKINFSKYLNFKFIITFIIQTILLYGTLASTSLLIEYISPEYDENKELIFIGLEVFLQLIISGFLLMFAKKIIKVTFNKLDLLNDELSEESINAAMAMSLGVWYRLQKSLSKKQEFLFNKIFKENLTKSINNPKQTSFGDADAEI